MEILMITIKTDDDCNSCHVKIELFFNLLLLSAFTISGQFSSSLQKMKTTKLRVIFFLVCSIGCCYQIYYVSKWYSKYQTKTLIEMRLPLNIQMPSLSTCFRLDTLLDRDAISKDKKFLVPIAAKNWTNFYLYLQKLSAKDIFKFTPKIDGVLSDAKMACMIRYPDTFAVKYPYPNASECYQKIKVQKYLQRQFMCYKFSVQTDKDHHGVRLAKDKNWGKMSVDEYSLSPNLPGLIFSVFPHRHIFGVPTLTSTFVHGNDSSPLFDSIFARSFEYNSYFYDRQNYSDYRDASYLNADISYSSVRISRLPTPYDSNCKSYQPFRSRYEKTLTKVRKEAVTKLNLLPTFAPVYEDDADKQTILSSYHTRQSSVVGVLNELMDKYSFDSPECKIRYYLSRTTLTSGSAVKFSVHWPQDVYFILSLEPEESLLDFIIYISSVIGLWFGTTIFHVFVGVQFLIDKFLEGRDKKTGADELFFKRHNRTPLSKIEPLSADRYQDDIRLQTLISVDAILSRFEEKIMRDVKCLITKNVRTPFFK